jgi:hypothetical protein
MIALILSLLLSVLPAPGASQEDPNAQYILLVSGVVAGAAREFEAPVESKVIRLQFTVQLDGEAAFTLLGPSGRPLTLSQPNISEVTQPGRRVITIYDPKPGQWRVRLSGNGGFAVSVTAQSELYLCCLQFLNSSGRGRGPRPALEGSGAGDPQLAQVAVPGFEIETIDFKLVAEDGAVLDAVRFRQNDYSNTYNFTILIAPPARPFRLMVRGTDATGQAYQRVWPRLFPPQAVGPHTGLTGAPALPATGPEMIEGEHRIVRAEVLSVQEVPLLSEKGNPIGIRLHYEIRFPKDGYYSPFAQLFPDRPTASYTGALSLRAIKSRVEPEPEGAPTAGQFLGRASYKRDLIYRFTIDLVPNYLLFNEQKRTFCLANKVYGHPSPERFEREIKSEARIRYRISIAGTDYDSRKQVFTENSYVPHTWYTSFLKEGAHECE